MAKQEALRATDVVTYEEGDWQVEAVVEPEENGDQSSFRLGDIPRITVYTDWPIVRKWSNFGTITGPITQKVKQREEIFYWTNNPSKTTLNFIPVNGSFSYEWLGNVLINDQPATNPKIIQTEKNLNSPKGKITGVLKCTYSVPCYIFDLTDGQRQTMPVFWNSKGAYGSCQIDFSEETAGKKFVRFKVKDFCTKNPVTGGARVFVDGREFITDAEGMVDLGELTTGKTYPVRITAAGYVDSDKDNITNDEFTLDL